MASTVAAPPPPAATATAAAVSAGSIHREQQDFKSPGSDHTDTQSHGSGGFGPSSPASSCATDAAPPAPSPPVAGGRLLKGLSASSASDAGDAVAPVRSVALEGSLQAQEDGSLALVGSWNYDVGEKKKLPFTLALQPLSSPEAATQTTPPPSSSSSSSVSLLELLPRGPPARLWLGSFEMENMSFNASRKKRHGAKRFRSVPERVLATFSEPSCASSTVQIEGLGRNRFGHFVLSGALDLGANKLVAAKRYKTQCAVDAATEDSLRAKRPATQQFAQDADAAATRASKRQRVPSRLLEIDSRSTSYGTVAKTPGASARPPPAPAAAAAAATAAAGAASLLGAASFASPELMAHNDPEEIMADIRSVRARPVDAERAAAVRARARRATSALVKQLAKERAAALARKALGLPPLRASDAASTTSSSIAGSSATPRTSNVDSGKHAAGAAASAAALSPHSGSAAAAPAHGLSARAALLSPETRPEEAPTNAGRVLAGETDENGLLCGPGACLLDNGAMLLSHWSQGRPCGARSWLLAANGRLAAAGDYAVRGAAATDASLALATPGDAGPGSATGRGSLFWGRGDRFDGELRDGRPHGWGALRHAASGARFAGEWERGVRHGEGEIVCAKDGGNDGSEEEEEGSGFAGSWARGRWNGKGRLRVRGRVDLRANFKDNRAEGRGTCEYGLRGALGRFDGTFRNGSRDGRGVFSFPGEAGHAYEGRFSADAAEGFGALRMKAGAAAEKLGDGEWLLAVPCQPEMRMLHRAAGFSEDGT